MIATTSKAYAIINLFMVSKTGFRIEINWLNIKNDYAQDKDQIKC